MIAHTHSYILYTIYTTNKCSSKVIVLICILYGYIFKVKVSQSYPRTVTITVANTSIIILIQSIFLWVDFHFRFQTKIFKTRHVFMNMKFQEWMEWMYDSGRKIGSLKRKRNYWDGTPNISLNRRARNFSGKFSDTLGFDVVDFLSRVDIMVLFFVYCRHWIRFHLTSLRYDDDLFGASVERVLILFLVMHSHHNFYEYALFLWRSIFSCCWKMCSVNSLKKNSRVYMSWSLSCYFFFEPTFYTSFLFLSLFSTFSHLTICFELWVWKCMCLFCLRHRNTRAHS